MPYHPDISYVGKSGYHSTISPDHRRFAKTSGHHAISQSSFISVQKISTGLCLMSLLSCISIRHINKELSIIPDQQLCNGIKYQSIMVSHLTECYVLRSVSTHPVTLPMQALCQTSLCWRHLISVNRHMKYARAGTMSIQQKAVDIRHI